MLCANTEGVKRALQKISVIQLEHFKEMIPETIAMIWEKGLHTEDYFIKLAGAGGGGFFLGIGENKNLNFETHPITFAKKN